MYLEVAVDPIVPRMNMTDAVAARAVLYTGGISVGSNRFLSYFLRTYSHLFDGEPVSFDPPENPDGDQIQILIQNAAGNLQLCAFPKRIELRELPSESTPINIEAHMTLAERLLNGYRAFLPLGTAHVECSVLWLSPDDDSARTISRYFCQERWVTGPLDGVAAYQFLARKFVTLGGRIEVDSWLRCMSHLISDMTSPPIASPPAIFFDQSFKTYGPELAPDQIVDFFRLAPEELTRVLRGFFPPAEGAVP